MWDGHLEHWSPINERWTQGKGFRQYVAYLDGSQDPWWTKNFALSGKVSRVGRVMPSMSRLLLCGGAGTPLLVETYSGQASIKKQLQGILERVDEVMGEEGELGRLLVVDAELMRVKLFEALDAAGRQFITVLKGAVLRNLRFEPTAEAVSYRQRDTLRDGVVQLSHPDKAKGSYPVRVVEMLRQDSRHPTPTFFATNAPVEDMDVATVATAYLERWPHNEQVFRRARHGAGMQHSHGFGHRSVHNVALVTEREKVESRLARLRDKQEKVSTRLESLRGELDSEKQKLQALRKKRDGAVYVESARRKVDEKKRHVQAISSELEASEDEQRRLERKRARCGADAERLASMPETIEKRDVELDSIATVLKLTAVALFEYILREFFGGKRMELSTFNAQYLALPVRMIKSRNEVRYVIAYNRRSPKRMQQLRDACDEVNRRRIHHRGRLLVLELDQPEGGG
jgi:hypothetical protein